MSDSRYATPDLGADEARICIVGLGYVGLPLAYEFDAAGHEVWGFDIDPAKVETLESGTDPTDDIGDREIATSSIEFTSDASVIADVEYVIVTVPTPVDGSEKPDLSFVADAGRIIGRHIQPGSIAALESTVYPGGTRSVFAPAIEQHSGMTAGEEFGVGYAPERVVPGDREHTIRTVTKLVSGLTEGTRAELASLFETVVDADVHETPTIEAAETAKCIENVQRDLNIALVNELAIACSHLGLDTSAVLEAAGTKWNFHEYEPGLVGGHCIPVDPFYLIYETERNGFSPELIRKGREVNSYVPEHVANMTMKALNDGGNVLRDSTVLVLGLAYKPDVGDVRTSAIDGVIESLEEFGVSVVGVDPIADDDAVRDEFGIEVRSTVSPDGADGIVIGTPHSAFDDLDFEAIVSAMSEEPIAVDVDGTFEERLDGLVSSYKRL
ncbi:nucleotide sugar dehydrogenase [Natrinema sp. LN54]|uniref:nucleotide sugar dehydrogenase n=1 Tax=Natrinema sp. LN54 TaxID=3458705 RepID=UPI004036CE4C